MENDFGPVLNINATQHQRLVNNNLVNRRRTHTLHGDDETVSTTMRFPENPTAAILCVAITVRARKEISLLSPPSN